VILNDLEGLMKAWMLPPLEEKPITCPRSGVVPRVEFRMARVATTGGGVTTDGGATTGGGATMGARETMNGTGNNCSFGGVRIIGGTITGVAVLGVATATAMVGAAFAGEGGSAEGCDSHC